MSAKSLGGSFDRLPGVVVLELGRAEIAERGMESARIVTLADELDASV